MSALDDLKAAIAAHQDLVVQLKAAAKQADQCLAAAHHAVAVAQQALLKTKARPREVIDGKIVFRAPVRPSDAVIGELNKAISASGANVDRCEEIKKAAHKAAEDAENELAELERTWPPELGPFPKLGS
jgi:hypothetical protein